MKVRSSVFASFILIFEVIGFALFLRGFFPVPVKSSFSSKSKLSDLPAEPLTGEFTASSASCVYEPVSAFTAKTDKMWICITGSSPNSSRVPQPLFKRVVIMLVDALREDFVFGPSGRMYMPYTRHLVERGSSHSFVAKARPPTVTMPRIKVRSHSGGGSNDISLIMPVKCGSSCSWQVSVRISSLVLIFMVKSFNAQSQPIKIHFFI